MERGNMPENTERIIVGMPKTKFSIRGLLWRIGMFLVGFIVLLWFAMHEALWAQLVAGAVGVAMVIPALVVLLAMMGSKAFQADVEARARHDAAQAEKRAAEAREARARSRAGFEPGPSFLGDN